MINKNQVMFDIECCICHVPHTCNDCSKYEKDEPLVICMGELLKDSLELLKEHEHSGIWEWITEDEYRCSECKSVTYVDECMNEPQYLYCPYCGCKMTFEGNWVRRE